MTTHDLIAKAKEELKAYARSLAQRPIFWTRVSATSADGSADGVEGWPAADGDPSGQQPVRRGEPWGVHGRPVAGVQALVARVMGGVAAGVQAAIWTGGHGRQNLDKGETQLYCVATGAEVYLDKNGAVFINAASGQLIKTAGGTDFEVKGTTYRNAERTFNQALQVYLTAMAAAWTAMATAMTTLGQPAAATAATTASTASTTAATAATAMEAAPATYLSTIAKVG